MKGKQLLPGPKFDLGLSLDGPSCFGKVSDDTITKMMKKKMPSKPIKRPISMFYRHFCLETEELLEA